MQFSAGSSHRILFMHSGQCENLYLDQKLLRHILTNLISNAIKYSPPGSPVYFNLTCIAGEVTFQIRDVGIGIPSNMQDRLFKPFQRADNVGDVLGTGLGLTMVKRCLDLHGGQIVIKSEVGTGTNVLVKLFQHQRVDSQRERPVSN